MKKILVLFLVFATIFSFAACSKEEFSPIGGNSENEVFEEEFVPARGTVENGIYENKSFGIKYSADADWYYYSDEEIAEVMGVTVEEIFSEEYKDVFLEAELIYDMYCSNLSTGSNVNINYENIGLVYDIILDEKSYLEISQSTLEESLSGSGILLTRKEIGTAKVGGKEVPCLYITMDIYGTEFYEVLVAKKCEDWMGVVTLASLSEEELPVLLENLSFK